MIKEFTQRRGGRKKLRLVQFPRKAIRIFCLPLSAEGNLLGTMSAPANEQKSNSSPVESYVTQLKEKTKFDLCRAAPNA
jgi:hypothetical protein